MTFILFAPKHGSEVYEKVARLAKAMRDAGVVKGTIIAGGRVVQEMMALG
jgi:hypothetical protein